MTLFQTKSNAVSTPSRHQCVWCGDVVQPGDPIVRFQPHADSVTPDWRMHRPCYDVAQALGTDAFTPFSHPRANS